MKVTLVVDDSVHFNFQQLRKADVQCFDKLRKTFTYNNPDFFKNQRLGFSTQGIQKRIRTYKQLKSEIFFNRGSLSRVKKILRNHGHKVKIHDHRLSLPPVSFSSKIKPHDHQHAPVEAIIKKQQGIIRGDCSSGKTVILLEAIAKACQPAVVIVWNTDHQKQWISEAKKFFRHVDIGGVGGLFKKPKFGKLNVCMQQSLWKENNLDFFRERVGFVGADEIQRFAANTFQTSLNAFPAKYRVGVSANERRKDGKEFLVYDALGKVIHIIPESATASSRIKAKIFLVPTKFYSEQYDMTTNWPDLLTEMSQDPDRNKLVLKLVKRSVDKKKVCLVLTERVSHALFLKSKLSKHCKTLLLVGNQTSKTIRESGWPESWKSYMRDYDADRAYRNVKRLAAKRKVDVIIATQKGDVGLSIKTVDHLFITSPTGTNPERFNQQKGRAERWHEGKSIPRVYYLWDVKNDRLREAGNQILKLFPGAGVLRLNNVQSKKGQ